ncbi:MAG: hypothetical protein ABSF03_05575 [Streptosporangiaceae bacterium]|jgi:hypothetical protein
MSDRGHLSRAEGGWPSARVPVPLLASRSGSGFHRPVLFAVKNPHGSIPDVPSGRIFTVKATHLLNLIFIDVWWYSTAAAAVTGCRTI